MARWRMIAAVVVLGAWATAAGGADKVASNCRFNGVKLYGRVQVVESFPDLKVKVVESFPDLKVKTVDSFPDTCGQWKFVGSGGDFKIKFVESFPDITVKFGDAFPGLPSGQRLTGDNEISSDCTFKGKKLYGRVALVAGGGDVKVRVVDSSPNLKVRKVTAGADECGEWEIVEGGADLKVQFVDSSPDFTIRFVDYSPGL